MIFAPLNEAADRGELILVNGGMCRYHLRKDGVTVIREIIVLPCHRRHGIGRRMVGMVIRNTDGPVVARCPATYESNAFWKSIGFTLDRREGDVNVWVLPV